jgi:hypothetical protein
MIADESSANRVSEEGGNEAEWCRDSPVPGQGILGESQASEAGPAPPREPVRAQLSLRRSLFRT